MNPAVGKRFALKGPNMFKRVGLIVAFLIVAATFLDLKEDRNRNNLMAQIQGKWMLETSVCGDGFIGSSLSSVTTPPHEIVRDGQKISFTANLQTAKGDDGQAIKEPFTFTLEQSGSDNFLSVESKSWLNLKHQKLAADASGAEGHTSVRIHDQDMSLAITIELTRPAGHSWDFTASDPLGKDTRWFKLTFKPIP